MLPILNTTGKKLELNTLFIQPTRYCTLSCPGCYVKEHVGGKDSFHTPIEAQLELFKRFYRGRGAYANQITISMDNFPTSSLDEAYETIKQRRHMTELYRKILFFITSENSFSDKNYPKIHMTFNSDSVLKKYAGTAREHNYNPFSWKYLSMISFSNIKDVSFVRGISKSVPVNYNHLIPSNVTSLNIDKHIEKMIEIGEIVDSIYLVMFKSPIGRERNKLTQIGDQSRMKSDISYINTMMQRLPEHIKKKINVDGCLKDTIKYSKTGFGCSSNVSRFQVWPDGSVSGCAYSFDTKDRKIGRTTDEIMDNIREAKSEYDFNDKCHLPDTYDSICC